MKPHNHRCNPFSRRPHQDDPKAGNDGRKHRCIDSRPEPLRSIPAPNIPNPTTSSAREGTPARSPSRHGLRRPARGECACSSTSNATNQSREIFSGSIPPHGISLCVCTQSGNSSATCAGKGVVLGIHVGPWRKHLHTQPLKPKRA